MICMHVLLQRLANKVLNTAMSCCKTYVYQHSIYSTKLLHVTAGPKPAARKTTIKCCYTLALLVTLFLTCNITVLSGWHPALVTIIGL